MNKLNLKKLGSHDLILPTSLAICLDFVSIWGSDPSRAHLNHLCAGAIGVAVDHAKILPHYKPESADPIQYGYKILDRLLSAGITPAQIYSMGVLVLAEMLTKIPKEEDVENTANFT